MDFFELVKKCRSVRRFDNSNPVSSELLEKIAAPVRFSPSSRNLQPLKFYLCADQKLCREIRPATKWGAQLENYNGPEPDEDPTGYIAICLDTDISENEAMFTRDVGICAELLVMSAAAEGVGACMIGSFNRSVVSRLFGLGDKIKPMLVLALGYPSPHENIILEDESEEHGVTYYRTPDGAHHVPKRKTENIIFNIGE
ncbi:MAG: nitroreductase family protein [Clostridia bacterium]|nr:nitroreductase family protein [Clostridia bacterium]